MKATINKMEIVDFFKQRVLIDNLQTQIAAQDFTREFNLQQNDLAYLEEIILRMNMDDLDLENMRYERLIDLYKMFNKFLFEIKKALGYQLIGYSNNNILLEKVIDPPSVVFDFAGHNKINIDDSNIGRALLYK